MTDVAGPFDGAPWAEAQWARHAAAWAPSGVYGPPAASTTTGDLPLSVSALTVGLGAGRAWVRGFGFERTGAAVMQAVSANTHASFSRRDRIVLRRNLATHTITPVLLTGTPASSPEAPVLTQSEAGSWDLPLFSFLVPPSSGTTITGIVDERVWVNPSGRLVVGTMASRPTSGLTVGDAISALDHPSVLYVWDGTRWVQEGVQGSMVASAPAGSYVTRVQDTKIVSTDGVGQFSFPLPAPFSATPTYVVLAPGDTAGNASQLVSVGVSTTGSLLWGVAFQANGAAAANVIIRANYTAIGYNT